MNEIFKDIPNYEGMYQVSNLGRVKSLKFNKEKILKLGLGGCGYLIVAFCKGKQKTINVHQLVAIAFLNHKPNGNNGLIVDHKDNNPLNNRLENLQLISHRENLSKDRKGCSSKYIGVCWSKKDNKWVSSISINGERKHLGLFKCELEASAEYQKELEMLKKC